MRHAVALVLALALPALAQEPPIPAPPPGDEAPLEVPAAELDGLERAPQRLVHRFEAGRRYRGSSRQHMAVDQGPMGQFVMDMMFVTDDEVAAVRSDGGALMSTTYRDVVYEISAQGQSFVIDTREGKTQTGNPAIDAMANFVGAKLEVTVAADGTLEQVTGGPALVDRIVADLPPGMKEGMAEQLGNSMNDEQLARQFQETYIVFPAGELAAGQGWKRAYTMTVEPVGAMDVSVDYVYLGVAEREGVRCAKLYARHRSSGCQDRDIVVQGMPAVVSISPFTAEGSIWVRVEDGILVDQSPRMVSYTTDMEIAGQKVHIKTEMTATGQVVEVPQESR
jgi:hypothetical protein